MLKLFIAAILALSAVCASATDKPVKVDKEILCFPVKGLLKDLKDKYGEELMVIGKHSVMEDVVTAVYINRETGTYTIIEMDYEAACVISIGTDVHYRSPKLGLSL
jgi:hypothetical protein